MLDWKIFAILSPFFFVTYQSITKFIPKNAPLFLINAYGFFIGSIVMLILHLIFSQNKSLALNSKTLLIGIGIGTLLNLGNLSIIKAYNLGAPQSIFSIVVYALLIILGILFGVLFWHEKLSLPVIFGALLSLAGILVIIYSKK
ncbi:MAG TPA: EamA family transporter [Candidatus Saccharimonadales bacterium]|nr:EamA family transporter [Candidatus Saccharimonadales bacterium]